MMAPPIPARGGMRAGRAAVLTLPAVGAASLTHSWLDGCASLIGMVCAVGICWSAAVALLGRQRSAPLLALWVLAAQLTTHVLLESGCREVTSGQSTLVEHVRVGMSPTLLIAHLVCGVLTAAALSRADAGLWAARRLLRAAARVILGHWVGAIVSSWVPPATPTFSRTVRRAWVLWRGSQAARRGPPALA